MTTPLRVGAVNYLNTKPLIERLTGFAPNIDLTLDLPSRLADRLAAGELDVGLIPVVEFFRGDSYSFVPNVAIGSRGPVLSVTLFSKVPWEQIRSVSLDEGSRTSAALTRIVLQKRYGVRPTFEQLPIDAGADDLDTDAVLLIGDRAMRACLPGYRFAYDLGEEWTGWTGLPMVFAVWAVRGGVELGAAETAFHRAKEYGLANAGLIAQREAPALDLDPGYCRRYMTNIIRYDLGPTELAGLRKYRELAEELGLVAPAPRHPHAGRAQ
ncbi:menaquinone biosynthesis protein [Gemmata sp. JC717]|uniref:menaquinone biosynthetic enzyme MqnA/MqnD family protein n=1 Tax=Gemmata algarum TaxID=2975278 RepID=UPI0021BB8414|nr:menaquinone biosynthesis protein [Gemmata algarum]MDY3552084.1 menaquinone biosynthesis protein [Gemmata algarum]